MNRKPETRVLSDGQVFSTGQVSRICNVSMRTVAKWCDSGLIESYRVPGSRDRRVTRGALVAFCHTHKVPLAGRGWDAAAARVLLVGSGPGAAAALAAALEAATPAGDMPFEVRAAAGAYAAGRQSVSFAPTAIVADVAGLGRIEACLVAEATRADAPTAGRADAPAPTLVAVTSSGEGGRDALLAAGYDVAVEPEDLAGELAKLAAWGRRDG